MKRITVTFLCLLTIIVLSAFAATSSSSVYVVTKNDNIHKIAITYKTTVMTIKRLNKLKSSVLKTGMKLKIPTMEKGISIEQEMKNAGLVDVLVMDPTIQIDLKYSTTDNFMKTDVYGAYDKLYLQKDTAARLIKAQSYLKQLKPSYSLLVYDGARPLSVQYKMWDIVKGTSKQNYLSDPSLGSVHNYGAAVDLTIEDENGTPLDMGTKFDYLGKLAEPKFEQQFLAKGQLTQQQIDNRKLLRTVMSKEGFKVISNEWWHFNAFPQDWTRQNLTIVQ